MKTQAPARLIAPLHNATSAATTSPNPVCKIAKWQQPGEQVKTAA